MQEITIPDVAENVPSDSSKVPVYAGERMTFQDLLYGTMLRSGNDGANAIAYLVGGSIAEFVAMMNDRAAEIGCTGTHFANAHGYHDETHYSTAYDLALITQEAMQQRDFPPDRLHRPPTPWPPRSTAGPTNITTTAAMVNPDSSLLLRGLHRRQDRLPQPRRAVLRGRARARRRFPHLRGAGRGPRHPATLTQKWEDTEKLFEYGLAQYQPYPAHRPVRRAPAATSTPSPSPTPPRTTPRRACWNCG